MTEKKLVCIMCPLGCEVTVRADENGTIKEVIGNQCEKGRTYAMEEFLSPKRVLTTTVAMSASFLGRLPVKTSAPIPKDKIMECMDEINKVKVTTMVASGDVIIHNILDLGVDVIATKDLF